MTNTKVLLLVLWAAAATAAPWPSSVPICADECPVTDIAKFKYETDKTYVYRYSGKSRIELMGVDGGVTETEWQKNVLLSWLSPCEMAITFQDVTINGAAPSDKKAADFLTKYPLVVAVSDGRLQQACSHPRDDPWSINMKKGVATAFQNVLPSLTPLSSGFNYTEVDVAGRCPTKYEVEGQGDKVVVKKIKDHRQCLERYPSNDELPKVWPKLPVPIERTWSSCKQEIGRNGIYSSISCKDFNSIRPSVGAYKHIEGLQESTLQYVSTNTEAPESLSTIRGEYVYSSMLYDHRPLNKDPSSVPLVETMLAEICEKTKESIEHDAAAMMADLVRVLKYVPEGSLGPILGKIRGGQVCAQKSRVENLFLDAIAFTQESGPVDIMVDELLREETTRRNAMYTYALYNMPHPSPRAIGSLLKLFQSEKYLPNPLMSAASMVNTFCHHYTDCYRARQVKAIVDHLNNKLQQQCKPCDDRKIKFAAMSSLIALGNIGVMPPDMSKTVLKCIETKGVDTDIHVAAIRAFRLAKCQRYVTMNLVDVAVDPERDTEVRVQSYLNAMRCVNEADLQKIFTKISVEDNTQVRSFVLSHLLNIQRSKNPEKKHMRYLLNDFKIPSNYTQDFRRYSRNIDSTVYSPTLGLGGGLETNIIYAPGAILPRSIGLNLTSMLYGQAVNFGAMTLRVAEWDEFVRNLFGPSVLMIGGSTESILEKITKVIKEKGSSILGELQSLTRQRRSIDVTSVADILKKVYGEGKSKVPSAEFYANVHGQDIVYKLMEGNLNDIDFGSLFDGYFHNIKEAFTQLRDVESDYAQMLQLSMDYHLPTIQGTPLRMKIDGTVVLGMKLEGNLNLWQMFSNPSASPHNLKIIPSLSIETNGFIGYDCFLGRTGLQMNNTVSSNSGMTLNAQANHGKGMEVHLDLPENMEFLHFESETYLMKMVRGAPEEVIMPPSIANDRRVRSQSCVTEWEQMLGFKLCYNVDVPDIFRSSGLPLGPRSIVKLQLEKTDPSLKGYKFKAALQNNQGNKEMKINIETKGSSSPKKSEAVLSYTKVGRSYHLKATVAGPNIRSGVWITIKNENNEKAVQAFAEYKSSQRTLSQGLKFEITTSSISSGSSYDISFYASQSREFPQNSKIYSVNALARHVYPGLNLAIIIKTENALRDYIALTYEAALDLEVPTNSKIPVLKRLRRMEFLLVSAGWKMTSFYRHEEETTESSVRTTSFRIGHRGNEMFVYDGTHTIQGNMERDFSMRNKMTFLFGDSGYRVDQQFFYGFAKTGVVLTVLPVTGTNHYVDIEATLANSDQEHKLLFLVDIPSLTNPIRFHSTLTPSRELGSFQLQVSLDHGARKAFEMSGPAMFILSPIEQKISTNLQMKILEHQPIKFNTNIEFTNKKILVFFELASHRESIFLLEWKVGATSLQETHIAFRIDVMNLLKHRLDVILKPNKIEIAADNDILSVSAHQRRVKGDMEIHYVDKRAKIDFSWDVDHNPSKRIVMDSHVVMVPSQPGHYSIVSSVRYANERTYDTKLDVNVEYIVHPSYGQNGFKFTLTNPERKTLVFELDTNIESKSSHPKIETVVVFKNLQDMEFKLSNLIDLQGMSIFKVASEIKVKMTDRAESSFRMMVESSKEATNSRKYIAQINAAVSGAHPIVVKFSLVNEPNLSTGELKAESQTPSKLFSWKVVTYPRKRGLQTMEIITDCTGMANLLKAIRQTIVSGGSSYPAVATFEDSEKRALYHGHYAGRYDPQWTTHTVSIQTPDRRMEMESQVLASELKLSFNPDSERSDAKYEASLLSSRTEVSWSTPYKHQWQARLSHPSFIRDKQATLEIITKGAGLHGSMEIDILPDVANKLTGTITSIVVTENTIRLEASFSARILQNHPKLLVTVAYAPKTKAFDVIFQKNPSSPVSFKMAGKYDQISSNHSVFAFEIESERQSVLALSAKTKPQMEAACYGIQIDASAVAPVIGGYDIQSKLCRPTYIEFSIKEHNSMKAYTSRIGIQDPNKAEVSISVEDKNDNTVHNALLARVMLISTRMVNADFDYHSDEINALLNSFRDTSRPITSSVESWLQRIMDSIQEAAKSKSIEFPSAEFMRELNTINQEASTIFHDLRDNKVYPLYEKIRQFLRSATVSQIVDVYYNVWSKMAEIHRDFRVGLIWTLVDSMEAFSDITTPLGEDIRALAHMMQTSEVPEFIQTLRRKFEECWLYQSLEQELEDLGQKYPEQYQAFLQTWHKIRAALLEDLEKLRGKLMSIAPVAKAVNWLKNNVKSDYIANLVTEDIAARILQETIYVSMTKEPNHMGIQIPLRDETQQSLSQVMQQAIPDPVYMAKNVIWSYDTYMSQPLVRLIQIVHSPSIRHITNYLPPFNGTAIIVGNTEILTFDGVQFRIPETPCRIRLVTIGHTTVSYERKQNEEHPTITVQHFNIKAKVKPDFTAYLNGQKVTDHGEMFGTSIKETPYEVYIATPFLTVNMPRNTRVIEVQVSGWGLGKVAGVLGSFDDERDNDWMIPTGILARDAKQFVTSWQEDHNCHTPDLAPVRVSESRLVECHVLVGMRSRCNPIIDPQPFIEMCRQTRNPCDVAKAYRNLCLNRGVYESYPLPC